MSSDDNAVITGFYQKLLEVQAEAHSIPKQGFNKSQKYNYVKSEDVIAAARSLFVKHGLVAIVSVAGHECIRYDRVNDQGSVVGSAVLSNVEITVSVIDATTGYREDFPYRGSGWDTTDKAVYKAITGATKYAYLALLNVSTGDDPEDEGEGNPANKPSSRSGADIGFEAKKNEKIAAARAKEAEAQIDRGKIHKMIFELEQEAHDNGFETENSRTKHLGCTNLLDATIENLRLYYTHLTAKIKEKKNADPE